MTPEMRSDQIGSVAISWPPRRRTKVAWPIQVSDGVAADATRRTVVQADGRRVFVAGGIAEAVAGETVDELPAEDVAEAAGGGRGEVGEAGHGLGDQDEWRWDTSSR